MIMQYMHSGDSVKGPAVDIHYYKKCGKFISGANLSNLGHSSESAKDDCASTPPLGPLLQVMLSPLHSEASETAS